MTRSKFRIKLREKIKFNQFINVWVKLSMNIEELEDSIIWEAVLECIEERLVHDEEKEACNTLP